MTLTEKIRNDFVHLKTQAKHNSLFIAGDFNLPDINWNKMTIEGSTYPNHINKSFVDIIQDLCMEQIVDFHHSTWQHPRSCLHHPQITGK
jgi:protein gp37